MARKKVEGSKKKPTLVKEFIKLEDLPKVLKQKFDSYRLSEHSLDFAMRVAGGENPMTVVKELYNIPDDNRALIKQRTNALLGNPKIQQMVKTIGDNLKHETYIDSILILKRMDILYTEAVYDENPIQALNVLREMAKVIKDNSGTTIITDMSIQFTLPNVNKIKEINAEDAEDAQVIDGD
jgi:hypothetical protein